ncbi:nucleotide-diphospho-sugar transferase [Ceratobasidium sp. AG-I]|nr:nucleotide-diphospho-sugar transferase [Ceratobasidium sp. AG-I]
MHSELVERTLAEHRRDRFFKTIRAIVLATALTFILVLLGSWNAGYVSLRGPSDVSAILNESGHDILAPAETTPNSSHHQESPLQNSAAQQVFGDHVRASSLWPISSPRRPRFSYVLYATQKEYLCNALINFRQLRKLNVSAELALIYPSSWDNEHSESSTIRLMLHAARSEYKVNMHPKPLWSTSAGDRTWHDSLTKLHVFGLTNYTRVVYLDSDGIVLNNLDHLFLAPQAQIALPRAYWLDGNKLASHIMVITPSEALSARIKARITQAGSATGFDMEIMNEFSASSSLILPHRQYAMLTGEFRNTNHSRYLSDEGPGAEWDPHVEMSKSFYIHFSDWPLPKPWIKATSQLIEEVQPKCDPAEKVKCWNREHWLSVYSLYGRLKDEACVA